MVSMKDRLQLRVRVSRRGTGPGAWLASVLFLGSITLSQSAHPADGAQQARDAHDGPVPARHLQLRHLVEHDCGSCHGMTLAGGLGPPLTAAALQDKPLQYLEAMILRGRPGTAMPGWAGLLSQSDARWIAQQLKEGFRK